jgi:hypothetical protein
MKAILVSLMVAMIVGVSSVGIVSANPIAMTPPIVNANNMKTSCSISNTNGELWASVDIEYTMNTILSYGDSVATQHLGTYNVVDSSLDAHYPMPLSAKNISIQINKQEIQWQYKDKEVCHIFGSNLPVINWTINPVPKTFTVTVHYDQPIPTNSPNNSIMGHYALVLPLIPRFGSTDTPSFPLYSWFDYGITSSTFSIQTGLYASLIDGYLIARGNGSLSKADYSTNNTQEIQFQINGQTMPNFPELQTFPFGAVITINGEGSPTSSSSVPEFPIIAIIPLMIALFLSTIMIKYKTWKKLY